MEYQFDTNFARTVPGAYDRDGVTLVEFHLKISPDEALERGRAYNMPARGRTVEQKRLARLEQKRRRQMRHDREAEVKEAKQALMAARRAQDPEADNQRRRELREEKKEKAEAGEYVAPEKSHIERSCNTLYSGLMTSADRRGKTFDEFPYPHMLVNLSDPTCYLTEQEIIYTLFTDAYFQEVADGKCYRTVVTLTAAPFSNFAKGDFPLVDILMMAICVHDHLVLGVEPTYDADDFHEGSITYSTSTDARFANYLRCHKDDGGADLNFAWDTKGELLDFISRPCEYTGIRGVHGVDRKNSLHRTYPKDMDGLPSPNLLTACKIVNYAKLEVDYQAFITCFSEGRGAVENNKMLIRMAKELQLRRLLDLEIVTEYQHYDDGTPTGLIRVDKREVVHRLERLFPGTKTVIGDPAHHRVKEFLALPDLFEMRLF